ncbi:MAG: hypothetical protein H8F28_22620 [Fibrella sp.]|nr:hypothetical protein [Armatimonadota bacterium]
MIEHEFALTHYRTGNVALDTGDYPLAVGEFTLALEGAPDHTPTRFALAKAKCMVQDYAGALSLINQILTEVPKHPGALLYYVRILGVTEQWNLLAHICTDAVLSVSGEVRFWLALALAETDRLEQARSVYESIRKSMRNRNAALDKRVSSVLASRSDPA